MPTTTNAWQFHSDCVTSLRLLVGHVCTVYLLVAPDRPSVEGTADTTVFETPFLLRFCCPLDALAFGC